MTDQNIRIAIVGATGAVGSVALQLLLDRDWPAKNIVAMASHRSAGKEIAYGDATLTVIEATPDAFEGIAVAFISADSSVSRALAPEAVKRGALVIDDGNAFRMQPNVPLVIPEVNGADVEWHEGIISIPNCTTTPLAMTLAALHAESPLTRVIVSTYQAVTGTGAAALQELNDQTAAIANGEALKVEVYPHPIAMNVLPQVDDFQADGYTNEEHKMINETRKILHLPDLRLSVTCVRVPVPVSHSEAVHAEFESPISAARARELLSAFPGIEVVDDPNASVYPMPHTSAGVDEVQVGRIREDLSHERGLSFWLSCDNLRKGAALNALQIMDEVVTRSRLPGAAIRA